VITDKDELDEIRQEADELARVLRERLEGRRIKSVAGDRNSVMYLDDGTVLRLYQSESDCCASAYGEWVLDPDNLDAMITDVQVKFDEERSGDDGDGCTNYVTIAILHNQNPVAQADCQANDGNGGYYYSILSLDITHMIGTSKHDMTLKVVEA
jgi:hypothetical protein